MTVSVQDISAQAGARALDVPQLRRFLVESRPLLEESESAGRIHPALVSGLAGLGFFDLMRPRVYGGMDAEYHRVMQLIVEASRHSGSLGWCLSIFTFHNMVIRRLPARVVEELFSSPVTLIASALFPVGKAVPCDGGYLLTGQWRYTSGIHVANWVMLRAVVEGEGKPYEAGFFAPADKFEILDDWATMGMRATGSNGIAASSLFLDARHKVLAEGVEDHRGAELRVPLSYRLPNQMVISLGTLAPAIGILEAMVAQSHRPLSGALALDEFSEAQSRLETRARVGILVNAFWKEVENALQSLSQSGALDHERQLDSKLRCSLMMKMAIGLATEIFQQAGTKAVFSANPLSRMMSDLQVLSTHYLCRVDPVSANLAVMSLKPAR